MSEKKPEAMSEVKRGELGSLQEIEQCQRAYWQKEKQAKKAALILVLVCFVFIALVNLPRIIIGVNDSLAYGQDVFSLVIQGIITLISIVALIAIATTNASIASSIFCRKEKVAYQTAYRRFFVLKTLKQILRQCNYNHYGSLPKSEISGMEMLDLGDRIKMEDLITGNYKGVGFQQADIEIKKIEKQQKHTGHRYGSRTRTILKGRYTIFDIKKDFDYRLALVGKNFKGLKLKDRGKYRKFKEIKVESKDLHDRYDLYAEDGFEAFYILDPAFIARLEALGDRYSNRLGVFFDKGKMHIVISDGSDAFKIPSAKEKIDEGVEFRKVEADIRLLTDLVDDLKVK